MSDIARQYRDAARAYVKENGRHTPTQLYEVLGPPPDGFRLKADGKGSVSIESFDKRRSRRTRANDLRIKRAESKGIFEDSNYRNQQRQARNISSNTLHQHAAGGRPSIVEHDVALQRGGSNSFTSISDPYFKEHKDNVESKVYSKFGKDKFVVDIDNVSGDVRVIPAATHNKFQETSKQKGVSIPQGSKVDLVRLEELLAKTNGNGKRNGNGNGKRNGNGKPNGNGKRNGIPMPGGFSNGGSGSDIVDRANSAMFIGNPMLAALGIELF